MRSLLSIGAAGWFIYNALTFIPQDSGVFINELERGGMAGDPGAVAVTWATRQLFIGLALIALALIEWQRINNFLKPPPDTAPLRDA